MSTLMFLVGIAIMTVSGSLGALFLKKGVAKIERLAITQMIKCWELYLGAFFYLIGALANVLLLRQLDYTLIYPLTSLTYLWTMMISVAALGEKMNRDKVIAIVCIVAGAYLIIR